ncbi:MAG: isoamylase early set domain-containing protein [Anaerolineae bacterium]
MITKAPSQDETRVWVTFELPACLWIESAYLVGDFNDWDETAFPFRRGRNDETWHVTLELERGREYQFCYLINGEWHNDWHADKYAPNAYGGDNSVVVT